MFFVAVLAALILLNKVDGIVKAILAVVILLALLLFVRRIRKFDSP